MPGTPENECPHCNGLGFIPPAVRMGETVDCTACDGTGHVSEDDHA